VILLNTCAIREKAEEKVFSKLGELKRLKADRPDLVIGVMGCMAQLQQATVLRRAPQVDLVFGSPAIARVGELVERARLERRPVLETGEAPLVKITAKPASADRLKAFVTVMEGCEKHCTFCVVPRTRGRERSHAPASIIAEIEGLVADGCREVTLLGQTVNAYGRDLAPPTDLAELFERVNDVAGLQRIRFTTSNPYNLTPKLIRAMRDVPKVCEWFHLPLQSGSDRVLERMNRGYTRARYLELVDALRDAEPAMAFSTDVIVGFPGETEADFEATLDVVERVGYDNVFAFRYSRRPGTPSARAACAGCACARTRARHGAGRTASPPASGRRSAPTRPGTTRDREPGISRSCRARSGRCRPAGTAAAHARGDGAGGPASFTPRPAPAARTAGCRRPCSSRPRSACRSGTAPSRPAAFHPCDG